MEFVPVTASVPRSRVSELLAYAAELCEETAADGADGEAHSNGRTRWGWGRRSVRDAYLGGASEWWPRWLEFLAARPDTWVSLGVIADGVGLGRESVPGMLGAGERRCGGRPPYEKKWINGEREFRMPDSVAEVILELAEQG